MFHGFNGHLWVMGLGWIIGAIILAIIVWLILKVVNQKNVNKQSDTNSPLDILKKRYARGEIDKAEFEEKKKALM